MVNKVLLKVPIIDPSAFCPRCIRSWSSACGSRISLSASSTRTARAHGPLRDMDGLGELKRTVSGARRWCGIVISRFLGPTNLVHRVSQKIQRP